MERPEKLYHKLIMGILEDKAFTLHEGSEHHVRSHTNVNDIVQACDLVVKISVLQLVRYLTLGRTKQ